MPSPAEILTQLQPLFREVFDVPDLVLTESLAAKDVEAWDSLNHIRVIAAIEQKFAVRLTSQEVESLTCVGDVAKLLANKVA